MKTAISLPDDLFSAAERAARRLGLSRSELFRHALLAFLRRNDDKLVTEALNQVHANASEETELHPTLAGIQALSVPRDDW